TEGYMHILALDVTGLPQALAESGQGRFRRASRGAGKEPDHRHRCLLCARRERPRSRAAEQRDELAAFHSMTSSARASSVAGISRPRALAVGRLMTSSNLVDCTTGSSAGLSPLRTRPA